MAYTVTDFQTQLTAINAAIDAEDKKAAYKAYAKAEVIHTDIARNIKLEDQGSTLERRKQLDGVKQALDSVFAIIAEQSAGGMAESFFTTPGDME